MLQARRQSTNKLYKSYLQKWTKFCKERRIDYHSPSLAEALDFLQQLREDDSSSRGYSAICTARSALSAVIVWPNGGKFGDHPQVKQYIKGVFNQCPPKPRYTLTWDPAVVVSLLKSWYPATKLSLMKLTKKLVMLILLITGQRGQIITALNVERMHIEPDSFTFMIQNKDIKQGRQNYKPGPIKLRAFPDKRLCVVNYLKVYLNRTLASRGKEKQLFLTTERPVKAASRDTISRWVKDTMKDAGLDISTFKPGSTRAAATSKAHQAGVPMDEILRAGAWSSETTFRKWYKKELLRDKEKFVKAVLKWKIKNSMTHKSSVMIV